MSKNFRLFFIPGFIGLSLLIFLVLHFLLHKSELANVVLLLGIAAGSWQLVRDTYTSLRHKSFALDYIAILAIITGIFTGNFLVAAVIVLMMAGGNTLEAYAQDRARRSLTSLSNRIPHEVLVINKDNQQSMNPIERVAVGSTVLVRKGEVIPLDGILLSESALVDESSLTGEPFPVSRKIGSNVQSGTLNLGEVITLKTTVEDKNSTYRHIIKLVEAAQLEKTPFLQLANKLSGVFTIATLILAAIAYLISGDVTRVLAVLVIATPCPLILATPVALIGGMNAAASERIIFKRLGALEILSRIKVMVFDKTGTITFGVPKLTSIEVRDSKVTEKEVLALASGLERNSLHPFAKAIMVETKTKKITPYEFNSINEKIGSGLKGNFNGAVYEIKRDENDNRKISLLRDKKVIATFEFTDILKPSSTKVLSQLQREGLELCLFTGDSSQRTAELLPNLPKNITVKANCSPEDKRQGILDFEKEGKLIAMVGDGINDAPALALADVGIVFSHAEHTAASEAADIILLGGTFEGVIRAQRISKHTLSIAKQSMYVGLGLSMIGMIIAITGHLPPIVGAISQEFIDVAVILNALRAALPPASPSHMSSKNFA